MRVLVTGGVRSGKSAHAERLLADDAQVTYVAAGPTYDDDDWRSRVAAHQARRPRHWQTVETTDVAGAVAAAPGGVLVECLGTWLTALMDEAGLWEAAADDVSAVVGERTEALRSAIATADTVVVVTNEVGLGVIPEHRSGRLFRDLLGTVNQQIGTAVDQVHLVVAGRVLRLT